MCIQGSQRLVAILLLSMALAADAFSADGSAENVCASQRSYHRGLCAAPVPMEMRPGAEEIAVLNNRGVQHAMNGDHNLAISDYSEALRIDPNYTSALIGRANAHVAKGDDDRALKDFNAVFEAVEPAWYALRNRAAAYNGRGLISLRRKAHDEAIGDFTEAVQLDRISHDAYRNRAEALLAQGKLAEALVDVDRALWLSSEYTPALRTRARIYFALDRSAEAAGDEARAGELEAFARASREALFGSGRRGPLGEAIVFSTGGRGPGTFRNRLYPPSSQNCTDGAKHVLSVGMADGAIAVQPTYAGLDGSISVRQDDSRIIFNLGNKGCRVEVAIAKGFDGVLPRASSLEADHQAIVVPGNVEVPSYERRFYEPPSSACAEARIRVRVYWGYVEVTHDFLLSSSQYRLNNPTPPKGIDSHRYGDEGCMIEIRTSKVD